MSSRPDASATDTARKEAPLGGHSGGSAEPPREPPRRPTLPDIAIVSAAVLALVAGMVRMLMGLENSWDHIVVSMSMPVMFLFLLGYNWITTPGLNWFMLSALFTQLPYLLVLRNLANSSHMCATGLVDTLLTWQAISVATLAVLTYYAQKEAARHRKR